MRNEEQKMGKFENEAVSHLLGSLKRVEAPGDFEFRVKARIAKGRPVNTSGSLFPAWFRFAVPLVLLLIVGGYFGYRGLYAPVGSDDRHTVQTAEILPLDRLPVNAMPAKPESGIPSADQTLAAQVGVKSAAPGIPTEKPNVATPEKLVSRTASASRNQGGGSYDTASSEGRVIRPKGFDGHRMVLKRKDVDRSSGIAAKDLLMQLGVDAAFADSSWKVGGVKQNSMAEHSGLKTGDVIESINDQILTEKTTLAGPFSGKSVRVRRGGKSVQIDLKP